MSASSSAGDGGGTNKLDDSTANSLRFWIQKCTVKWTSNDTAPYQYTACSGSRSDVVGTTATQALPSAGTCPPAAGSVSSVNAVESLTTLSNISANHGDHNYLVVFMCMPTATPNEYQNASATFTFTFSTTQRSGTTK